nr:putative retrotransposon Ty1-copia subclass protein [Tanacetum cinerariifolium]
MTTSVVNNSVFRGFFEKQKLTRPNFIDWYRQPRIALSVEDKLDYLKQPIPPASIPAQAGVKNSVCSTSRAGDSLDCKRLSLLQIGRRIVCRKGLKNNKQKKPQLPARGQNQGKGKNKLAYAPKPKIPPPPKRENPTKDSICHQCGDTCHWKRNCPQKLNPKALSLYVGNGQRAAVEAIGTYHLCLPNRLVIVLNNCHYAPFITRGIILVSCLYDGGYVNRSLDNTISVSRNNMVYFSTIPRDGIFEIDLSNSNTNNSYMYANSLITQEASGSLKDLEIIQEEDTHPSINTSLNHEEDDLETDDPQSDIIPIRRSTRTRNALNRMYVYMDAEEHELGDFGEPTNYKAALLDLDKWLFKKKTDIDGVVHTFKARLVAKGFTQTYRVDYEETFYPVIDIRGIRILIAIVAYYDYEIWKIDVKTAFFNGHLSEEVYMEKPEAPPMDPPKTLNGSKGWGIQESIDSSFARFNTIITSLKPVDEGKKERVKFIALKAKKESSDDETSTSGSDDEEYAMAVRNFKKFFRRKGKFVRKPREEKKLFRQRDDKKGKSDRKCFRCGDPNLLVGDCPKPSRNKDQKAFIRGSWSDSENDAEDKTNDETCLMAQSSNEGFAAILVVLVIGASQSRQHGKSESDSYYLSD